MLLNGMSYSSKKSTSVNLRDAQLLIADNMSVKALHRFLKDTQMHIRDHLQGKHAKYPTNLL